jgi:hypothetical protein
MVGVWHDPKIMIKPILCTRDEKMLEKKGEEEKACLHIGCLEAVPLHPLGSHGTVSRNLAPSGPSSARSCIN